ncbi:hypothetical protein C8J55DRAFT_189823 [Lentinula edodes]|uniref:Uncharacterized protein n=1 Tax=Lentinula lateritia TaxID=40482 RepID=A0A9W8ZZF5_9AGAR|nr:hypothetical protein C8J55DRAFT_189823 [Lentinula edodes]
MPIFTFIFTPFCTRNQRMVPYGSTLILVVQAFTNIHYITCFGLVCTRNMCLAWHEREKYATRAATWPAFDLCTKNKNRGRPKFA